MPPLHLCVLDLEATCWQDQPPAQNEIIELGALHFDPQLGTRSEFQTFVRPRLAPQLSDFCRELTSITQHQVDTAPHFPEAFAAFQLWRSSLPPDHVLASWGAYDRKQLLLDTALHGIPFEIPRHLNIKHAFAELTGTRPMSMSGALGLLRLPLHGTHHRGIDDARNIARILAHLLERFGEAVGEKVRQY